MTSRRVGSIRSACCSTRPAPAIHQKAAKRRSHDGSPISSSRTGGHRGDARGEHPADRHPRSDAVRAVERRTSDARRGRGPCDDPESRARRRRSHRRRRRPRAAHRRFPRRHHRALRSYEAERHEAAAGVSADRANRRSTRTNPAFIRFREVIISRFVGPGMVRGLEREFAASRQLQARDCIGEAGATDGRRFGRLVAPQSRPRRFRRISTCSSRSRAPSPCRPASVRPLRHASSSARGTAAEPVARPR